MNTATPDFVLCIDSSNIDDLEKGKVYQKISDHDAESEGYLRVVDETDEDYLYPARCFVLLELPLKAREALVVRA